MKISDEAQGGQDIRDSVKSSIEIDSSDDSLDSVGQCTGAELAEVARIGIDEILEPICIGHTDEIGVPFNELQSDISFACQSQLEI